MEFLLWTADEAVIAAYGERAWIEAGNAWVQIARRGRVAEAAGRRCLAGTAGGALARLAELSVFCTPEVRCLDRRSDRPGPPRCEGPAALGGRLENYNRRQAAENDETMLVRLAAEYEPQLSAYGA